jgi:hypothetical protein
MSHCILGLLVLPSKEWGPKVFSPLILALIRFLRFVSRSNFLQKFHDDIGNFLDETEFGSVRVEEVSGNVGREGTFYQGKLIWEESDSSFSLKTLWVASFILVY